MALDIVFALAVVLEVVGLILCNLKSSRQLRLEMVEMKDHQTTFHVPWVAPKAWPVLFLFGGLLASFHALVLFAHQPFSRPDLTVEQQQIYVIDLIMFIGAIWAMNEIKWMQQIGKEMVAQYRVDRDRLLLEERERNLLVQNAIAETQAQFMLELIQLQHAWVERLQTVDDIAPIPLGSELDQRAYELFTRAETLWHTLDPKAVTQFAVDVQRLRDDLAREEPPLADLE
jgi:hypothetical protein